MSQEEMRPFEDYIAGLEELLPSIQFRMQESTNNVMNQEAKMRLIDVVNIMERKIPNFHEDPLESIICGTSMALSNQGIVTDIKLDPLTGMSIPNVCIFLIFRNASSVDKKETLDRCDQKWGNLLILSGKERIGEYEEAIKDLIPAIKEGITRSMENNLDFAYYQAGFIQWAMGKNFGEEDEFLFDDPGAVLCGISPILFDNGIIIDIAIEATDACILFKFRYTNPEDKSPIIDECIEKWARLFVE